MPKPPATIQQFDILCVGDHPSVHLAATAAKARQAKFVVGLVSSPRAAEADRLLLANPKLFTLHPALNKLKKSLGQQCCNGAIFLSETPKVWGDYASKAPTSIVVASRNFAAATAELAHDGGVVAVNCRSSFEVRRVIDDGVEVAVDGTTRTARMLIVGSPLDSASARVIGHDFDYSPGAVQSYGFARLKAQRLPEGKQLVMSLDLGGNGALAWLLRTGDRSELAVLHPARRSGEQLGRDLQLWRTSLVEHGLLESSAAVGNLCAIDLPVTGALTGETVANRTLLVGPAGGFISACNEELYPGCWSAILAAEVAVQALKERHVQDALLNYRQKWGSTVGDYLRGPQQNLKLLLPLIYRNPMMASRVGEAIFLGESVVR